MISISEASCFCPDGASTCRPVSLRLYARTRALFRSSPQAAGLFPWTFSSHCHSLAQPSPWTYRSCLLFCVLNECRVSGSARNRRCRFRPTPSSTRLSPASGLNRQHPMARRPVSSPRGRAGNPRKHPGESRGRHRGSTPLCRVRQVTAARAYGHALAQPATPAIACPP